MSEPEQIILLLLVLFALFFLVYGLGKKKRTKSAIGFALLVVAFVVAINLSWPLTAIIGIDADEVTACSAFKRGGSGGVPRLSDEQTDLLLKTLEGHSARLKTSGSSLTLPAGTFESGEYVISFYDDLNTTNSKLIHVYGNGLVICGDRLYTLTKMPEYSILDFCEEHATVFE